MATNNPEQPLDDESNTKRQNIDTDVSTSPKPEAMDPFLSLPTDIVAKIIADIPVAQWSSLELLDTNFRAATWIAWRQLRCIDVERDLLIKHESAEDRSLFNECIVLILQKLVERSPFLTSLSVCDSIRYRLQRWHGCRYDPRYEEEMNSSAIPLLVQFEHLQSIATGQFGIQLEDVVEFLQSTRSRTSLKEVQLFNIRQRREDRPTLLDELASTFANGREIQSPLKLEKLVLSSYMLRISPGVTLDTLDTSRLIDLRLGMLWIEPHQLANLIERASHLRRIELSFLHCEPRADCSGRRLQANKKLLSALASHEKLTAMKFYSVGGRLNDTGCLDLNFGLEFIEMLKAIGRRGLLTKLTLDVLVAFSSIQCMNEICTTIRDYLPNLQSIELNNVYWLLTGGGVFNIVSQTELEEICISNTYIASVPTNVVEKIAQGSRLKRLALYVYGFKDIDSLKCLANVSTLTDLRIANGTPYYSAELFDKWSEGLVSNLQVLMLEPIGERDVQEALARLLEKAGQLRVLILEDRLRRRPATGRLLTAIARSCSKLEILGVRSELNEINVWCWQEIVDHCPKLTRLGGLDDGIRKMLKFPKYRKIGRVETEFWLCDLDDSEYDF